jgi:hypothetical protein
MSDLCDIPLDTPIPTTEALYAWSEREQVWVTWPRYVFGSLERLSDRANERTSGDRAAAPSLSPLFLEEVG